MQSRGTHIMLGALSLPSVEGVPMISLSAIVSVAVERQSEHVTQPTSCDHRPTQWHVHGRIPPLMAVGGVGAVLHAPIGLDCDLEQVLAENCVKYRHSQIVPRTVDDALDRQLLENVRILLADTCQCLEDVHIQDIPHQQGLRINILDVFPGPLDFGLRGLNEVPMPCDIRLLLRVVFLRGIELPSWELQPVLLGHVRVIRAPHLPSAREGRHVRPRADVVVRAVLHKWFYHKRVH
mmetsp:Transcript_110151/g.318392  ORF Transcript_110151/g.318392 Transcript_110151/m.318392 type:complete len:236 (-) Transcript_110151:1122-1829(-)